MKKLFVCLIATLTAAPVLAVQVFSLGDKNYALVCDDGKGYRFNGLANKAQKAAIVLCGEQESVVEIQELHSARERLLDMNRRDLVTAPGAAEQEDSDAEVMRDY